MKQYKLFYVVCLGLSTIIPVMGGTLWPDSEAELAQFAKRTGKNMTWHMDEKQCVLTSTCDVPKQLATFGRKLDAATLAGKTAIVSYEYKMDVAPGEKSYWGVNAFFQFKGATRIHCKPDEITGKLDWTPVMKTITFPENIKAASFFIGIEGAVGTASFRNVKLDIQK